MSGEEWRVDDRVLVEGTITHTGSETVAVGFASGSGGVVGVDVRPSEIRPMTPDPREALASLREDPPTGDPSTWVGTANVHQHGIGGPPCTLEHEWPPSHLVNSRANEAGVRAVLARHYANASGNCAECMESSAYGEDVPWPCVTAKDLADAGVVLPTPGAPE